MHPSVQPLKDAMKHATFKESEIKEATDRLINELGVDLSSDNADYTEAPDVHLAANNLLLVIARYEQAKEDSSEELDRVLGEVAVSEDDRER